MRAARLHNRAGRSPSIRSPCREPRPRDVLIAVKACGVIPNMNAIFSGTLWNHLPPLPASVGLDAAGIVSKVGSDVTDVAIGDRVYVNPWLTCGMCPYCRAGEPMLCSAAGFQGYFGFFPQSIRQLMSISAWRLLRIHHGGAAAAGAPAAEGDASSRPRALAISARRLPRCASRKSAAAAASPSTASPARSASARRCSRSAWARHASSVSAAIVMCWRRSRRLRPSASRCSRSAMRRSPIGCAQHTGQLGVDVLIDCSGRGASAADHGRCAWRRSSAAAPRSTSAR